MELMDKIIRKIAEILDLLSCVFLMIMMCFVVVYVLVRQIFGYAIYGTFEVVQLCSLVVVSFSLMHNEYCGGNITIDFLDSFVGRIGKKILMIFSLGVTCAVSGIAAWRMFIFMAEKMADGSITANLSIPVWIFALIMGVTFTGLALCTLLKLVAVCVNYEVNKGGDTSPVV